MKLEGRTEGHRSPRGDYKSESERNEKTEKRPRKRRGMRMKPRMKGWNPDRDEKRFKFEKLFVMLVLEIFDASRFISFLNFYTRVSIEHSRMEQIHTLFAAKY